MSDGSLAPPPAALGMAATAGVLLLCDELDAGSCRSEATNAAAYDDDGYMINAFNKGATDAGMLARILPAITDELWQRGYSNEDLAKIYGGNKMRVYQQVWEGIPPEQHLEDLEERIQLRNDLRERFISR